MRITSAYLIVQTAIFNRLLYFLNKSGSTGLGQEVEEEETIEQTRTGNCSVSESVRYQLNWPIQVVHTPPRTPSS